MFPASCSYLLLPAAAFYSLVVRLQVFSSDLLLLSAFRCLHVLFSSVSVSSSCSRLQSVQPVAVATDLQVALPTHSTSRRRETTSRIIFPEITATNTTSAKTGTDMPGLPSVCVCVTEYFPDSHTTAHTHTFPSACVCLRKRRMKGVCV